MRVLEKIGTPAELAAWGDELRRRGVRGEVSLTEVSPGVVRARVTVGTAVAVRDPGLARPALRPTLAQRMPMWSRWAVVGGAAALLLGGLGLLAYEAWTYRHIIVGALVLAVLLALALGGRRGCEIIVTHIRH